MLFAGGIIIISALIIYFEMPLLLKNKETKTIWAFFILFGMGIALNIALAFNLNIPNPLDFITYIFQPVADIIMTLKKS